MTPAGVTARIYGLVAGIPAGMHPFFNFSRGVASLDPGLIAEMPPASGNAIYQARERVLMRDAIIKKSMGRGL